jgi:formylglycine-generating enzyme required for sulfatase activity
MRFLSSLVAGLLLCLAGPLTAGTETGPSLVKIPPGTFVMGSDSAKDASEHPAHRVTISYPFWMGKHEVTQAEYEELTGKNPSRFKGPSLPVETVSWEDVVAFCRRLSEHERNAGRIPEKDYEYRLPTEAEWEYCCRAGTQTNFYFGDDLSKIGEYEWTRDNSEGRTHKVAQKHPNPWGLHDMVGNVREWCLDWLGPYLPESQKDPMGPETGTKRVFRSGDWFYRAEKGYNCCAHRGAHFPSYANYHVGLRVVLAPSLDAIDRRKRKETKRIDRLAKQLLAIDPADRAAAMKELKVLGELENLPESLGRLWQRMPGASKPRVWMKDGQTVLVPDLADGHSDRIDLPTQAVGVGVEWAVPHMVDRAVVYFSHVRPDPCSLRLELFDAEQWDRMEDGTTVGGPSDKNWIEYRFMPAATEKMRFVFAGREPNISEIEAYAYMPATNTRQITWPKRMVTGELEEEILRRGEEPSFESISRYGLSMPAYAMMGLKDSAYEQAVSWAGDIVVHGMGRYFLSLGESQVSLEQVRDTARRRLLDGWLPAIIVEGQIGEWGIRQTSFVAHADKEEESAGVFVRIELQNLAESHRRSVLRYHIENQAKSGFSVRDNVLWLGQSPRLIVRRGKTRGHDPAGAVTFDLDVDPGKEDIIEIAIPLSGWQGEGRIRRFQSVQFEDVLRRFKDYWGRHLESAMRIELPESRLNHMYKAVLAQILINAHGDVMPYGAYPSQYDGGLYGHEEGIAMITLHLSGLHSDAHRYMNRTYLTESFLRKVEAYSEYRDRHQQVRNGLQPIFAVSAYRLSRNKEWASKHVELLKKCAEWTIAQRRKTMKLEDGKKPLHWGLLPKWTYGGDVADVHCYAVRNNLTCWKALRETAWLLRDLGDEKTANRYFEEAADYLAVIDAVLEKIYRPDDTPPFLPLRVYGTRPAAGDYYQLLAGSLLEILPFDLEGKHLQRIVEHLEKDNRLFCTLPRFRRDVGPGGLDAIYGMGITLTKLHQDRIREFLLGFYAYQVFNMEHTCFTSRETNAIYASDLHRRTPFQVPDRSDPLPCSSAVAVHLLRHMLVTEELEGAGDFSGNLLLLLGAPRRWFLPGKQIELDEAPTHYGKLTFSVESYLGQGHAREHIRAQIDPPKRNPYKAIKLRLRHPEGKRMSHVTVNGSPWQRFDPELEMIILPREDNRKVELKVYFE